MSKEQKISNWYNRLYSDKGINAMRPQEAYFVFLNYLHAQPGRKLLDIGCGTGHLLAVASQKELKTFGIDIAEEAVKIAKEISPTSFIRVGRAEELKFDSEEFDYITCLGSLEHFMDMKKSLSEMKRVTTRDALFCIMVPNLNYLFWRVIGRFGTSQQAVLERLLSLKQWHDFFAENGFEIVNIHRDTWYSKMNLFPLKNFLDILKMVIYKYVFPLLPLNYTYQFVFILRKSIAE